MGAPDWLDELDLHIGPPDASMGTRVLDVDLWLLVDADWESQREEARGLLRERRDDVLAGSADDAAVELAAEIDAWLAARHPMLAAPADDADPMAAARQRVAEDLCLLTPSADGWLLTAGAVCFPSYWRLQDKIGRPLTFVHEPVPGYAGRLASRVDTLLERLRPGQGVWRRNWSIHDVPDLFVPSHPDASGPAPVPDGRWLRSEYQTLVRLPTSEAVVFTIRTQQVPLADLAHRPDRCAAMAAALRGWSPTQRAYKGTAVDDALLTWLDSRPFSV